MTIHFKNTLKRIGKYLLILLSIPILYFLLALLFSIIPINDKTPKKLAEKTIYLSSNGVHLDLIFTGEFIPNSLLKGLNLKPTETYIGFGWGDRDFYINTPNWSDLKLSKAFKAMLLNSKTLVHITPYFKRQNDWLEVHCTEKQFQEMVNYLNATFKLNQQGDKQLLQGESYGYGDRFYEALGSYNCFNTCNAWVNTGLKKSDLKAALWTPFDFGVLWHYED